MAEALSRTVSDAYRRVTSGIRQGQGEESDHAYQILAARKTLLFQCNLEFARDRLTKPHSCGQGRGAKENHRRVSELLECVV